MALGVYTDLFRRPGAPMGTDEMFDDLRPSWRRRSGSASAIARTHLGMDPALLRRVAAEAERLGVVLTFEVQGTATPDAPAVVDVLSLQQETGSPYLGLTIDFSLTTRRCPPSSTALPPPRPAEDADRRRPPDLGRGPARSGRASGTALGEVAGHPQEQPLTVLVAGVLGRSGRTEPAEWADVLPLVRHAHAKFWDPDVESVRAPHGAWLAALDAAGYAGAVVSEWGGHELLDRADADALTVTRAHLELLAELPPTARGDGMTMTEGMVRPDALSARDGRLALAVHLPWYRSLPISCLESSRSSVDGVPAPVTLGRASPASPARSRTRPAPTPTGTCATRSTSSLDRERPAGRRTPSR